jgi:hypothetical protein
MLELVKEALDQVALPIDQVVDRALDLAVTGGRDVRPSATGFDEIDDSSGVIATVSDEVAIRLEPLDQSRRNGLVGRLTLRKHYPYRHSLLIDHRVDLGAQSSARTTDGVIRAPFLPPAACW